MNPVMALRNGLKKIFSLYGGNSSLPIGMALLGVVAIGIALFLYFDSATPNTITITTGPVGSSYQRSAEKYKKILAKEGITLKIIPSEGSVDNLKKLLNPKTAVDVGFVQGGQVNGTNVDNLVSLGSVNYQPILIFYRGKPKTLLSEFKGQRLDIGPPGSGTHEIALTLLKANGIEPGSDTAFVDSPASAPLQALLDNQVDALFVMGDSTSSDAIRQLLRSQDINLFNVSQADGYTRRFNYLNKLEMPKGAIDFGKNLPAEDVSLVGPTVELVARNTLHPALSDALLEAAQQVHSKAGLFRKRGEFPAPQEHEFRISSDAARYYTTGKSFLYRTFPFWLASLINRIIAFVVPLALLLIPAFKIVPAIYRWRMQSRIYPWYETLLEIEREAFRVPIDNESLGKLLGKLNHIEFTINTLKVPASYGDMFYGLRGHIGFVRERLLALKREL